ncbi:MULTISPECIES: exonuclease SbcCD subunit D [Trueperella]|uniref:Nuclease SbcCD subunit D n=1 Tax=Trueperella abortisuis TaxID=445930 RepID=A0ABT9PK25_9ACTO|nr:MULTISPECIES: exonuclease SbcCD subunit D [Trueperella]MDP9833076.1 exonuclease SbcD [Trueperella abortisuis]MDY5404469.1 exonuclease SbcCD subunit D [Trueperella sp.]
MRFLHTADWHLGREIHGADLTPAFEQWADHVVDLVASEGVDALFISGDVYDRAVPPVAMVELLSDTLSRLLEHTRVIMTSGNHDSPQRLGFGSAFAREGLHICTDSRRAHIPVVIDDGADGALIYPIPYLDPPTERDRLAGDEPLERSHIAVNTEMLARVEADMRRRGGNPYRIVLSHSFVIGAQPSESERDISVGGADSIPSHIFRLGGLTDYVALGHIHGPQAVGTQGDPLMRYSGSPIAFSFSEEKHVKSSVLLDTRSGETTLIPAPVYRPLATLEDTLENLLSAKYAGYGDHFLRIRVTDPDRPADLYAKLKKRFAHMLALEHVSEATAVTLEQLAAIRSNPLAVLREFFAHAGGRELTAAEDQLVAATWEEVSA